MHAVDPTLASRVLDRDQALVDEFGSPIFVFDAETIRANIRRLTDAITHRPLRVHFAIKAHANVQILRMMSDLGIGLDACSPGDLAFAQAAGVHPHRVSYTGCGMTDVELSLVIAHGALFVADSLAQLDAYGRLHGTRVGLRINVGVEAGFHQHVRSCGPAGKFGVHPHQLPEALALADRHGLRLTTLHVHLGSDLFDPAAPIAALERLIAMAAQTPHVDTIDVGGGWGHPFHPGDTPFDMEAYGAEVSRLLAPTGLGLLLEPGGYLVQNSGFLLTRVTEIKPATLSGNQRTPSFVFVDTSTNHTISALLYQTQRGVWRGGCPVPTTGDHHLCGNLMQAGDVLARGLELDGVEVGEVLAIENAGAYCAVRASTFNERPRPAEVLVDGECARLIRRAEDNSDLLRPQILEEPR